MRATPSFDFGPGSFGQTYLRRIATPVESRRVATADRVFRRRPTVIQGHALEVLGHAIEYLVDSRMHRDKGISSQADSVAEQVLMRLSREVFAECAKVVPAATLRSRVSVALRKLLAV
jgi:hypothetical protein